MHPLTDIQLDKLHDKSSLHFNEMALCRIGVCFYCLEAFSFEDVKEWTDCGMTAICPKCHIDAVLPGTYRVGVLEQMRKRFFESRKTEN